jgi:hypothetical protein
VLLDAFSCGCGKPRQYHFPCSHYVAAARHRNFAFESRIPSELSVESLVRTWSPRFEPFLDESQWPTYTGPVYVADPAHRWDKRGSRKRSRCNIRDGNGFKTRGCRDYKPVPVRLMLNPYPHPLPATGSVCYPNPLPAGLWHPRVHPRAQSYNKYLLN